MLGFVHGMFCFVGQMAPSALPWDRTFCPDPQMYNTSRPKITHSIGYHGAMCFLLLWFPLQNSNTSSCFPHRGARY